MKIVTKAQAGTLESGDIHVEVEAGGNGLQIDLDSSVINLYGAQITKVITETAEELGIKDVIITATDKGALDCTIKARVKTALYRACESNEYNW